MASSASTSLRKFIDDKAVAERPVAHKIRRKETPFQFKSPATSNKATKISDNKWASGDFEFENFWEDNEALLTPKLFGKQSTPKNLKEALNQKSVGDEESEQSTPKNLKEALNQKSVGDEESSEEKTPMKAREKRRVLELDNIESVEDEESTVDKTPMKAPEKVDKIDVGTQTDLKITSPPISPLWMDELDDFPPPKLIAIDPPRGRYNSRFVALFVAVVALYFATHYFEVDNFFAGFHHLLKLISHLRPSKKAATFISQYIRDLWT